jgi:diazepam-binding inhibitor (GABA receptor modulating acyl-CoA-binding protein)
MEDEIEQLSAQFEKAISLVGQGAFKASDGDKLKLYGFFKQATVGKCNTPKPGFFDFVGKSKWYVFIMIGLD